MKPCFDLTGKTFGRWKVIEVSDPPPNVTSGQGKSYWLCKCVCGYKGIVMGTKLRCGRSKSCGCSMLAQKEVSQSSIQ